MENLIKASEQYQAVANEDDINIQLFNEFVKKISIWDCKCILREHYLSLAKHEKKAMIKHYYREMKTRRSGKNFIYFFCLI